MEADLGIVQACVDVFNGFDELDREAMRAANVANP